MPSANDSRGLVLSNILWNLIEKIGAQGISFVVTIVLSRLLLPEQYGLVAMLSFIIIIGQTLIDCGLGVALIQKKDSDDLDFNTVFFSSLLLGLLMYGGMYVGAPLLASFFNEPRLTFLTRIYTLSFLWSGYNSILFAYVSKHFQFKKMFKRTFFATILSGIVGITLAYMNAGVWALVAQSFSASIIGITILQWSIEWKPRLQFSWTRAKMLLSFSTKIMGANFIGTVFNELKGVLIGKLYTPADLAFFNKGGSFPNLIANNVNTSLGNVLFPFMANYGNDNERVKQITRRSIKISSYVMFFFLTILIVMSEPIVRLLLTEKWLNCVPFMQMVCLQRMLEVLSASNLQALKAVGEGSTILRLEFYKKPVFLLMTLVGAYISVFALAVTLPLYALYADIVNMWPNKRVLNYPITEQIKDVIPAVLLSLVVFLVTFPITFLEIPDFCQILLIGALGLCVYILVSHMGKLESYEYCRETLQRIIKKRTSQVSR